MSAIDNLIAQDASGGAPTGVNAIIARDAGSTPAQVPSTAPSQVAGAQPAGAQPSQQSSLEQDLAAGGGSPDTWGDIKTAVSGGAHGVGSMLSNAANFAERHVPFFPSDIAARDTAAQAQADQQFSQTASPGEKASAFVAPMLLPSDLAVGAGDLARAGISAVPGLGGTLGRVLGSTIGNAGTGALMSTGAPINPNQPTGPQDAQNLEMGAGLGAALPAAANLAKAIGSGIYGALRPVLNPRNYVGEGLANSLTPAEAGTAASNIRNAPDYVPGSQSTLAQVAGTPTLVATEKAAVNNVPGFANQFLNLANQNNAARWGALDSVAQTPQALSVAAAAREAAAQPLYDSARLGTYNVDPQLEDLLKRPAIKDALQRGTAIASNEGNTGFVNAVAPLNVPTGGTASNGQPILQQLGGAPAQVSGDVLHYLKLGLDDLEQSANENTRLGPSEKSAIVTAKKDYLNWLDNASPDYQAARQAYAAASPPVNSMEVGQFIQNKLGTAGRNLNSANDVPLLAQSYTQALKQAIDRQPYGINPVDQQTLENIGNDIQQSTVSNSVRSGSGSDTAYNLASQGWLANQLYGPTFGGAGNAAKTLAATGATFLGHPMVGIGILGGANKVGQFVGNRLNEQLGNLLLNPSAALPYLDARAATAANGSQDALRAALARQILPAVLGGVSRGGILASTPP